MSLINDVVSEVKAAIQTDDKSTSQPNRCPECAKFAEKVAEREPGGGRYAGYYCKCGHRWVLEGMPPKKCLTEKVLSGTALHMLKMAPTNPTTRAVVQQFTQKPLPEELTSFIDIREWIDNNCDPSKQRETKVNVEGYLTVEESGRCDYTAIRYSANFNYQFDISIIEEIINECDDNDDGLVDWSSLFERLRAEISDQINIHNYPHGSLQVSETREHESEDVEGQQFNVRSSGSLRSAILHTLQQTGMRHIAEKVDWDN